MKPAWDKLMKKYDGHTSILVADVDCTAAGKSLCDANGVEGFPTIRYGAADDLKDYDGERDLKSLMQFAKTSLGPQCSPARRGLCDATKLKVIEELEALTYEELDDKVDDLEYKIELEKEKFDKAVSELQQQHEKLQKEKETITKGGRDSSLKLMKAVLSYLKKPAAKAVGSPPQAPGNPTEAATRRSYEEMLEENRQLQGRVQALEAKISLIDAQRLGFERHVNGSLTKVAALLAASFGRTS